MGNYTEKKIYKGRTRQDADEMRRLFFKEHLKRKEIAERHGVSQATVSKIISNQVWASK